MWMGANRLKYFLIIFPLLGLVTVQTVRATGNLPPVATENGKDPSVATENANRYSQDLLKSLTGDIHIPQAASNVFVELFDRHKSELERMASAHQDLVWEMLGVVIEILPSLRTLDENGGQLHVARKTYTKVSILMERCELLAGPKLARDLRRAKKFVDARVKEDGPASLIIDLKK